MEYLKQPNVYKKCAAHIMQSLNIQEGNYLVVTFGGKSANNNLDSLACWISKHYPSIELPIERSVILDITKSVKQEIQLMSCVE